MKKPNLMEQRSSSSDLGSMSPQRPGIDLSIVIPCFDEAAVIKETIGRVCAHMAKELPNYTYEVIPVNDGSRDKTALELDQLAGENVRPCHHERNLGRGAAMKTGLSVARGQYILFLDADLSYDVNHISQVMTAFSQSPALDVVIVSPYMRGGVVQNVPFSRLILSRTANWILAGFFSKQISTVTSMVRGYKADSLRSIPILENGKEIHLEILRKAFLLNLEVVEIPGQLIWKETKERGKRLNKLKVAGSATNHLLYGILTKPTRLVAKVALILLLVGLYEVINLGFVTARLFEPSESFWRSLWMSMALAYDKSPHSFFIAGICLVLGIQALSFLTLFLILKMQHDEMLKHLIKLSPAKD